MASPYLSLINALIRDLYTRISDGDKNTSVKILDEIENIIDSMLASMTPERITDERFEIASKLIKEISSLTRQLRKEILDGRFSTAKDTAIELQQRIREAYRILLLIKSGAPTPMIFNIAPEFLREVPMRPPEPIILLSPMAARIYNIIVRKGEASIEDLARELNITDENRDEFNRSISQLISLGYATIQLSPDNKLVLKPLR